MKEQDAEIQEFQAYLEAEAKSQNKDPKSYIENLGEDGLKKAYQRFQDWKQKKTKKAAHGLKLNYIRRLKNQCEDGEVLVYYKTGGPLGCKCMKAQNGAELKKKKQVRPTNQDQATKDSIDVNKYNDQEIQAMRPGNYKQKNGKTVWVPDRTKFPYNKQKVKSNCGGSKIKLQGGGIMNQFKNAVSNMKEKLLDDYFKQFSLNNYKGAKGEFITRGPYTDRYAKFIKLPGGQEMLMDVEPGDTAYNFTSPNGVLIESSNKDENRNTYNKMGKIFSKGYENTHPIKLITGTVY